MSKPIAPRSLSPDDAGAALERALGPKFKGDLTIADAAAKSGLALRDAETGLFALVSRYRGHLRATDKGSLIYRFPDGFSRSWEQRTRFQEGLKKVLDTTAAVGRFVVRAWIAIVLVGYAALFLAIVLGMTFAGGDRDRGGRGVSFAPVLLRVIFDALFWTFHPFSPVSWAADDWAYQRHLRVRTQERKAPFYERVNRYFFGPTPPAEDPRATERAVVQEIRAQRGRIGLGDVIRVTGLPRADADPLLARLMLDYDGSVEVSDDGGIFYRFEALRPTVDAPTVAAPRATPIWEKEEQALPITGNDGGSNLLITLLNGFNLLMALFAIDKNLTLAKLPLLFSGIPIIKMPYDGIPIALGIIPIVFSLLLFALPIARTVFAAGAARRAATENGRRAMLRTILTHGDQPITDGWLKASFEAGAGRAPSDREVSREVVALGGDMDIEVDRPRYRFPDFEAEEKALEAEREAAADEEASPGKVVFSSDA